jgi:hypothetical protein
MDSIRDAFVKSEAGKILVIEARETEARIRAHIRKVEQWMHRKINAEVKFLKDPVVYDRNRDLETLVHDTFVKVPRGQQSRPDVYKAARDTVFVAAAEGGQAYDSLVTLVKYTWKSPEDYKRTIEALTSHN